MQSQFWVSERDHMTTVAIDDFACCCGCYTRQLMQTQ